MSAIETFHKNGITAKIYYDEGSGFNPRVDQDNLGTIIGWHSRYRIGDEHDYKNVGHWLRDMLNYEDALQAPEHLVLDCLPSIAEDPPTEENLEWARYYLIDNLDYADEAQAWALEHLAKTHLLLDLYMYDHSGVAYSTSPFSCRWDSGQVGFVYVSHEKIIKEYGSLNDGALAKAKHCLEAEVEEYSKWANGEVYYYVVKDEDGEELDSCGGYLGYDVAEEATKQALEHFAEEAVRAQKAVKEYGYA